MVGESAGILSSIDMFREISLALYVTAFRELALTNFGLLGKYLAKNTFSADTCF